MMRARSKYLSDAMFRAMQRTEEHAGTTAAPFTAHIEAELFHSYTTISGDDKDGINRERLQLLLTELSEEMAPTPSEIDEYMLEYARNGATLTFTEFLNFLRFYMCERLGMQATRADIYNLFNTNRGEVLTRDEFIAVLASLGEPVSENAVDAILAKVGTEDEGGLTFAAFNQLCDRFKSTLS